MRADLKVWLKSNFKLIFASCAVSFLSASVSGISLVLIQGVFGKQNSSASTDFAQRAVVFLGEDRAVLLSILIWGFATYFLNNFNERITSLRLDARRLERTANNVKINAEERRILTNESNFFESFIGFTNHVIRLLVFAVILLSISPLLIKADIVLSIIYLFYICKKRFQKGLRVGGEDRQLKRDLKGKGPDKDFGRVFDLFIQRSWLSARLDKEHLGIFLLLVLSPFILSDAFSLKVIEHMALFNFTTLLIFFSNAVALSIHTASIGFRFNATFSDSELEEEE